MLTSKSLPKVGSCCGFFGSIFSNISIVTMMESSMTFFSNWPSLCKLQCGSEMKWLLTLLTNKPKAYL